MTATSDRRTALASLALSVLLPSLSTSIANVGLPTIARSFGATFPAVQWIVLAYLLAITTLVIGAGRLGDMLGRRRLLVASVATFTAASLMCGVAPTLGLLIAARSLQGLGAAGMLALSMAIVAQLVPTARTGSAMGLLGTMSAVGTALGPPLGGVLISGLGWRSIFLVIVPLGVATLWTAYRGLPSDTHGPTASWAAFDYAGTLVLALTLGTFALAVTIEDGDGPVELGLLLAAGAGLAVFVVVESRSAAPLIRLRMFRDPTLSAGLTTSALVSTVLMCTLVIGPFYLSRALGLVPSVVGLVMAIGPVVAALISATAGRAVDRHGSHRMIIAGLITVMAGCLGLASFPVEWGVPGYVAALVVVTTGYAVFQAANNTAVMSNVPPADRGLVAGMANLARNLGLITGASVMGAVFALASGTADVTTAFPGDVAVGARVTFAAATVLVLVAVVVATGGRLLARRVPALAR